jgi:protein required for attachment to host cells
MTSETLLASRLASPQGRKNAPTWILVADASRARLFQHELFGSPLKQLQEWDHQPSRARNQDLASDRPGRVMQSHAAPGRGGSRSGIEPDLPPKEVEQEHFARALAAILDKGRGDNAYRRLVLVASPSFLGTLRRVVDEQVHKHIVASVDKDYTAFSPKELELYLGSVIHP